MSNITPHHIVARNFTLLSRDELLMVLARRNHPEIRRWMIHDQPITPEEHLSFCARLKEHPERLMLLVECDGQPISVLSFTATDASWRELKDSGSYSFEHLPTGITVINKIIFTRVVAARGIKRCHGLCRNDNERSLFISLYYYNVNYPLAKADGLIPASANS